MSALRTKMCLNLLSIMVESCSLQQRPFSKRNALSPLRQSPKAGRSCSLKRFGAFCDAQRRFFSVEDSDSGSDGKGEQRLVRLSKRMSELDICSRREADRLILDGRVLFDGRGAEIGKKVPRNATAELIEIRSANGSGKNLHPRVAATEATSAAARSGWRESSDAVVLNKPPGFVSGQAEHGNTPAIRLLTRENMWRGSSKPSIVTMATIATDQPGITFPESWAGFAPAGRLDLDSSGLLIFTKNGVLAKKIISSESKVEKEYIVDVTPAIQVSRRELSLDPSFKLPTTTLDLTPLLEGGRTLLEENKRNQSPLKPCQQAQWIIPRERLRIVITEGRKHHVRRMCRELVGWHVTMLQRVRIGPVALGELPLGRWRPIRQAELDGFLS
jgi:23S rRNA pseudouridine2604 synthase